MRALAFLLFLGFIPSQNAYHFKLFRVFYAVTDLYAVKQVPIRGAAFETRAECDAWRKLDVAFRIAAKAPTLEYRGEDWLILGSYCSGGMDI